MGADRADSATMAAEARGAASPGLLLLDAGARVRRGGTPRAVAALLGVPAVPSDEGGEGGDLGALLAAAPGLDEPGRALALAAVRAALANDDDGGGAPFAVGERLLGVVAPVAPGLWALTLAPLPGSPAADAARREAPSTRDALTGLPDRAGFADGARRVLSRGGPAALLLLDLDRFKAVNDTLGHPVGDALLRTVGDRLRGALRPGDLAARLGGDEFGVVAAGADAAAAEALAARLVDLLSRPYLVSGHLLSVGASVGVALAPEDGSETDALAQRADLALYAAKASGRGTHRRFDPAMQARAEARRQLETDLRRALPLKQFHLFYQPQHDAATGRLAGFEALLRWKHPGRGLVPPDAFIPVAEETGLIEPIGEWVIRAACKEAARWPAHLTVAVNVSPRQLESGALDRVVASALLATGLPGERLEVEVTETALMRHGEGAIRTLNAVRALGVQVSMDDFGTGYSSLTQLRAFAFDRIKIDRSFVSGAAAAGGGDNGAVVRAVAALGAELGMKTTAEGVETPEQLAAIRAGGCTDVQGYLFGRPVPAGEVAALIAADAGERSAA